MKFGWNFEVFGVDSRQNFTIRNEDFLANFIKIRKNIFAFKIRKRKIFFFQFWQIFAQNFGRILAFQVFEQSNLCAAGFFAQSGRAFFHFGGDFSHQRVKFELFECVQNG